MLTKSLSLLKGDCVDISWHDDIGVVQLVISIYSLFIVRFPVAGIEREDSAIRMDLRCWSLTVCNVKRIDRGTDVPLGGKARH